MSVLAFSVLLLGQAATAAAAPGTEVRALTVTLVDEKGLEAKNMFAEEYLNRTKSSDDNALEVDIYVFLK